MVHRPFSCSLNQISRRTRYTINKGAFKSLTKESAYALGFIAADGCLSASHFVLIVVSTDLDILTKFRSVLGSTHPITSQQRRPNESLCHRLAIGSRELYDSLLELGLTPRKSRTLTMPTVSDDLFFHFLRGYFDGDGSVPPNGTGLRISFTCGSRVFFEQLASRIGRLTGIPIPKIRAYPPPQVAWQMSYWGPTALLIADLMYADADDLYLKQKKDRIEQYRRARKRVFRPGWQIRTATTKQCARCLAFKPFADFNVNRRQSDGLHCYCQDCDRANKRRLWHLNKSGQETA